jgi:hypothetical protein
MCQLKCLSLGKAKLYVNLSDDVWDRLSNVSSEVIIFGKG